MWGRPAWAKARHGLLEARFRGIAPGIRLPGGNERPAGLPIVIECESMAQDHQKDTKPSEDNKVVSATGQAEGHGQAMAARGWPRSSVYERFVGWLAIGVLWIAQARSPELPRRWREKGRKDDGGAGYGGP